MKKSKQELRQQIRAKRKDMTPEDVCSRSETLCRLVLQTDAYVQAKTIYGYLPFNQEVDLTSLLQQALADGKQVALPKCRGREMDFILVSDLSRVQSSRFGAPEPIDDAPIAHDRTALVIMPGLVFDRNGNRVGYGGGYYDRFLAKEPDHPSIGLCFDFQFLEQLEPGPLDIPADIVFSI